MQQEDFQHTLETKKEKFKYNLKTLGRLAIVQALYSYLMQMHLKYLLINDDEYNTTKDINNLKNLDNYQYDQNNLIFHIKNNNLEDNKNIKASLDNLENNQNTESISEDKDDTESDDDIESNSYNIENNSIDIENIKKTEPTPIDLLKQKRKNLSLALYKQNLESLEMQKKQKQEKIERNFNIYFQQNLFNHSNNILNIYNTSLEILDQEVNIQTKHHAQLLSNISENFNALKQVIINHITRKDEANKIKPMLMSILITGACEVIYSELNYKIIINEFTNIASSFLLDNEIKFVNSILDSISKTYNKS